MVASNFYKAVKKRLILSFLAFLVIPNTAFSGEVLLSALKDLSPLSDAVLKIGEDRYFLSSTGTASFELPSGSYELVLQQYGQQLVNFKLNMSDDKPDVDISVLLEEGLEPNISINAFAANDEKLKKPGLVTGFVTSKETGDVVAGVVIRDESGTYSTTSAADGSFELSLPRGQYELSIASPDFATVKVKDFTILADSVMELNLSLAKVGTENLEEVLAIGSFIADTATADERDSSAILDVIGSEQLARFGDSSAASALKRVAGVSINQGKYAVVRGLNERYTAVTLNGSSLPSPDPTRRVVPLDIFPSSILSQINVSKSNSADLPSDSTGGVIELNTAQLSGEKEKKLSVSVSHTSNVTFSSVKTYEGGSTDFLGFDDGGRELPTTVEASINGFKNSTLTDMQKQTAGQAFENNYKLSTTKPVPNIGIEYSVQDTLPIEGTENQWGYIAAVKYKNEWEREDSERASYSYGGGVLIGDDEYQYDRTSNHIDLSAVFSAKYEVGTKHTFTSNTMLLRQAQSDAIYRDGIIGDNDRDVKASYLGWEEKQFFIQQFLGEHRFYNESDLKANWRLSFSQADLNSPDNRSYSYETPDLSPHQLYDSSIGREFIELKDNNIDFGTSLEGIVKSADRWQLSAKAGFDYFSRERDSSIERFGYNDTSNTVYTDLNLEHIMTPANINPSGFVLLYQTLPSDKYTGTWDYTAAYGKVNFEYFDLYKLELGARAEHSLQQLDSADFNGIPKQTELDDTGLLPSANLTWFNNESFQTRVSFSQTKNRPDFREISESIFYHPETRDKFSGNDDLEIAEINNFDLRGEWYFSDRESASLALFYKDFTRPIEVVAKPGGGDSVVYSFENQESAIVSGLEIDFKKEKEFEKGLGFISGNASVIDSEVTLYAPDISGNTVRKMQGQPENILNLQFGFDDYKTAWEYTLVLNRKGQSVFAVGVQDLPDIIEEPRIQVDVNAKNQVKENLSIKVSIDNITDSMVSFTQGGKNVREYKKNRILKGTLNYTF